MSKTWEHYPQAARHHERAACHYKEAGKFDEAEEHEKAAHDTYLAHGHNQHAIHHDSEAAKLHAEQCDNLAIFDEALGTMHADIASLYYWPIKSVPRKNKRKSRANSPEGRSAPRRAHPPHG